MIFRTFGNRIGCLAVIIFGLGYPWRFDWVGGAFLRQDWLAAVGVAVCLLKRKRFGLAGGLIAYATMVRVFPGGFLVGPAVVCVRHLVEGPVDRVVPSSRSGLRRRRAALSRRRQPHRSRSSSVGRLQVESRQAPRHVADQQCRAQESPALRPSDHAARGCRFQPARALDPLAGEDESAAGRAPTDAVAGHGLFLAVVAAAAWRLEIHEAAVLGMAVAFAVVVLTCYYWVMLLLVPLGRGDGDRPRPGWDSTPRSTPSTWRPERPCPSRCSTGSSRGRWRSTSSPGWHRMRGRRQRKGGAGRGHGE